MQIRKIVAVLICLLLPLMFVQLSVAGTTGKIAGTIIDKESGDPLPGANVIIEGTSMGAAADPKGNYTILHVPPGIYTVKASFMGYVTMSIRAVRVRIDQTTRVDFELEMEVIAGETIAIVAEKRVVKQDVATSVVALSADEVEALPLSNVSDVVELQAGVESGLVIRGGGADESLFLVDGVMLRDPRNNIPITGIALSAIKEISIERGGFNAEYGQVRSGIINVVTKEGSKTGYHGTITLKYSPPAPKHFGISPFDKNSMWLRPYYDDEVCWTGTDNGAWDKYTQRQYPDFEGWNEVSRRLLENGNPDDDLTPLAAQRLFMWEHRKKPVTDQPDYNIDTGFGGPVPFIGKRLGNLRFFTSYRREREMLLVPLTRDDYVDYDWSLKLTSDISPSMKLKISGLMGKIFTIAENWVQSAYLRTPEQIANDINVRSGRLFGTGYYSPSDISYKSFSAKLTHMLNPSTFYEASIEHVARKYFTRAARLRDKTKKYEVVPGYFVDEAPFGYSPAAENGITGMFFGGHTCKQRDFSNISSTTFKVDLTSQVNFSNLVKTGVEFVYNDLNLDYGTIKSLSDGNTYSDRVQMRVFPIRAALYLQDKLEAKGFIANIGLRLDYSNSNSEWFDVDPYDKDFFSSKYDPEKSYKTKKTKPQLQLSPRLGISHPITVNSKLFFNYGHFKQLPTYEELFRLARSSTGRMVNFGDPDLILAKTVSYELGYDHALFDDYLIQLAAFYHDITDQQNITTYTGIGGVVYNKTTSNSYEDIRGFELTLRKSTGKWWTAFANYTYQVSTSGHFGKEEIYQDPSEQKRYDEATVNMYQERPIPQPYARANILFHSPKDFGLKIMGFNPLGSTALNVFANWKAGGYRTWNPKGIRAISENVREKDWFNMELRFSKTFSYKKMKVELFVEVYNLLNTKRLSLVSWGKAGDYEDYMNSLHLPKNPAYDNIPGNDRVGDYRKEGVAFQPIEQRGIIDVKTEVGDPNVIYYERTSGRYMNYIDGAWSEVDEKRIEKVLKDKAYIDMPNQTSFNFLNPRQFFFGIRTSFDF